MNKENQKSKYLCEYCGNLAEYHLCPAPAEMVKVIDDPRELKEVVEKWNKIREMRKL